MNKKMSKIILLAIITFLLIVSLSANVFADNSLLDFGSDDGVEDFDDDFFNTNTEEPSNTDTEAGNTVEGNTNTEENTAEQGNTDNTANTGAGSVYEESDMPNTGLESSILMGAAFVVCAIIGIYTFMKLSAYSNI